MSPIRDGAGAPTQATASRDSEPAFTRSPRSPAQSSAPPVMGASIVSESTLSAPTEPPPPAPPPPRAPILRWLRVAALFVLGQWFLVGVGVVIALAHAYPNVVRASSHPTPLNNVDSDADHPQGRSGGIIKGQYTVKFLLVAIICEQHRCAQPLVPLDADVLCRERRQFSCQACRFRSRTSSVIQA